MRCRKFADDWEVLKNICYDCGSESIKKGYAYIRTAKWQAGEKFVCDIFGDDIAFFCGIKGKAHVRIISLAVKSSAQRLGLGMQIMSYEAAKVRKMDIHEFTLRTSMKEAGQKFWLSLGAKITGRSGNDWEMTLKI